MKVQEIYRHLTERPGRDHYEIVIANGEWEARLTPSNNTMHYTSELRAKLEAVLGTGMVEVQELDVVAV
jgi:DNA polymerase-3 subunit alpha